MSLTLQQLAQALDLEFQGNPELELRKVASLPSATMDELCFIQHVKYLPALAVSRCCAVIAPAKLVGEVSGKAVLISENPYYSFVQAIDLLHPQDPAEVAIHPSAQVSASARLAAGVSVGALSVVEDDVEIGEASSIAAGTVVEKGAVIGSHCHIHSRVTIGQSVKLGNRCQIHSGVVLGSDGFGLIMQDRQWHKIPQLGRVIIEDDVEIGANSTVDRGALDDTVIEQGCKLDNLIQIAHNVRIGAHSAIAACVGIAGSTVIGRYCKISGGAGVIGHLNIADNVTITAMSLVTRDIDSAGVYSSGTPLLENSKWHKNNVRYKSLDQLAKTVARLEKKCNQ
jgi:UDP-3-O-[3-hydroxymyristoyl] glucosamine N-acyltransferase